MHRKKGRFLAFFLATVLFILSFTPLAEAFLITRVNSQISGSQMSPSVSGDKVVWEDNRYSSSYDILLKDVVTDQESAITQDSYSQHEADISGSFVVWTDGRNGRTDIYLKKLGGAEVGVTPTDSWQYSPAVYANPDGSGGRIVWVDERHGATTPQIYTRTFDADGNLTGSEQRVNASSYSQRNPVVYGDLIAWEEWISSSTSRVKVKDMSTGQIKADISYAKAPDLYGTKLVWEDFRSGDYVMEGGVPVYLADIYMKDLDTGQETVICNYKIPGTPETPTDQRSPSVWSDGATTRVVWQDDRNGKWDIYMWENGAESAISTEPAIDKIGPDIDGERIVWSDKREGDWDVYLADLTAPDVTPPEVISVTPGNGATDVPIQVAIGAYFSEELKASTVNTSSFLLKKNGTEPVSGTVSYNSDAKAASFIPDSDLEPSTTYTATLTTAIQDKAGNPLQSEYSWSFTTSTDTQPPATPTGVTATAGDSFVSLSWDANTEPDFAGYKIYKSTTAIKPSEAEITPTFNAYVDNDVVNGTTYYYWITAYDTHGNESAPSDLVSATPSTSGGGGGNGGGGGGDTIPPAIPTGLQAVAGDRQVTLTWNANTESDLDGYNVYRALSMSGPWTKISSLLKTTSLVDGDLENGTTYYYRVSAQDVNGNESSLSPIVFATPQAGLPAPTGLTATPGDGEVTLSWDPVSSTNLAGYNVYRSTSATDVGTKLNASPIPGTTYTDTGLLNGVTYYYRVSAVSNEGVEGAKSDPISATPGPISFSFKDVSQDFWAAYYISYLAGEGLIRGYPDQTFRPNNSITRAEFAKIIILGLGESPSSTYKGYFKDVSSSHWAVGYIERAKELGIISGYPDQTFRPNNYITRAEIAKMVVVAGGYQLVTSGTPFFDVSKSHWAYYYILTARQKQIVSGYPDGTFRPSNNATRAEASKMVYVWFRLREG